MPGKSSRFTAAQNAQLEVAALGVLVNSERALTVEEIQHCDMTLTGYTPQKMSRVLNTLVDKGFVCKTKSKEKNRMVYLAAQYAGGMT